MNNQELKGAATRLRAIASLCLPLCILAIVLFAACHSARDWTKIDPDTINEGVSTLDSGFAVYHRAVNAEGPENARTELLTWLRKQENVDSAGEAANGDVWFETKNGVLHNYFFSCDTTEDTTMSCFLDSSRNRAGSAGWIDSELIFGFPFMPQNYAPLECCRSAYALQRIFASLPPWSASVLPVCRTLSRSNMRDFGAPGSVIFLDSHGGLSMNNLNVIAFAPYVQGEGLSQEDLDDLRRHRLDLCSYEWSGAPHVAWGASDSFFSHHLESLPDDPSQRSLVYLKTCCSDKMTNVFREKGYSAFVGYTGSVGSESGYRCDSAFFASFTDGLNARQAFDNAMAYASPEAQLTGYVDDPDLRLIQFVGANVNGRREKFLADVTIDNGNAVIHANCFAGADSYALEMRFPPRPGHYTQQDPDYAWIRLWDWSGGLYYEADAGEVGVQAVVDVESLTVSPGGLVFGSFSGVLGWWAPGHRSDSLPPDITCSVTNGIFEFVRK
jgi:hypothetical protein